DGMKHSSGSQDRLVMFKYPFSSASEGDTLEYDMSEDLEETPENVYPTTLPPPSTTRKR
ncbi:hypothetical protein AVEN_17820-1, partial [Araneus ventricosus]